MSKEKSVSKTRQIEMWFSVLRTAMAILISLVIAFILIATVSDNAVKDFTTLLIGPLKNASRMTTIVSKFIPLLFTGTAICLVNSAGQTNIGAEGAFFAGPADWGQESQASSWVEAWNSACLSRCPRGERPLVEMYLEPG